MQGGRVDVSRSSSIDALAEEALAGLRLGSLSTARFTALVDEIWSSGEPVRRLAAGASYVSHVLSALPQCRASNYGAGTGIAFSSQHLFGEGGAPGAVHVEAPPERRVSSLLAEKNKPPHRHRSARISVITGGEAVFFARRRGCGGDVVLEFPVRENDAIFYPSRVAHTFDAGARGFSLVSATASFSPEGEDADAERAVDLDGLPRERRIL